MLRILSVPVCAAFVCCVSGPESVGQQMSSDAICAVPLAKDITQYAQTDSQQYAFLEIIDQRLFEELKQADKAALGLKLPIVEAILDATKDYESFKQRRESKYHEIGWSSGQGAIPGFFRSSPA